MHQIGITLGQDIHSVCGNSHVVEKFVGRTWKNNKTWLTEPSKVQCKIALGRGLETQTLMCNAINEYSPPLNLECFIVYYSTSIIRPIKINKLIVRSQKSEDNIHIQKILSR
jgi:hypothetical protein